MNNAYALNTKKILPMFLVEIIDTHKETHMITVHAKNEKDALDVPKFVGKATGLVFPIVATA